MDTGHFARDLSLCATGAKPLSNRNACFPAGANPAGAGVWFTGLSSKAELIIAEGIESALSAALLYDAVACVATLSTHGMRKLVLPLAMRMTGSRFRRSTIAPDTASPRRAISIADCAPKAARS